MYRLIQAGTRPSILLMVAKVYIPVLFPLTFGIGLLAMWMDKILGFEAGFIPEPHHLMTAALSLGLGIIAWLSTYEQLSRVGAGSPSPTAGRTTRLVRTGWYAHSRNPSLFGKTLGVLAVGLLFHPDTCAADRLVIREGLAARTTARRSVRRGIRALS
jgi:protein-S-isoprenylcysteine O-methyltransferase Ste14